MDGDDFWWTLPGGKWNGIWIHNDKSCLTYSNFQLQYESSQSSPFSFLFAYWVGYDWFGQLKVLCFKIHHHATTTLYVIFSSFPPSFSSPRVRTFPSPLQRTLQHKFSSRSCYINQKVPTFAFSTTLLLGIERVTFLNSIDVEVNNLELWNTLIHHAKDLFLKYYKKYFLMNSVTSLVYCCSLHRI